MSFALVITEDGQDRRVVTEAFPLHLGGPNSGVALPDLVTERPVAFLGMADEDLFVQPDPEAGEVLCNGQPLTASRWLRGGDRLRIGPVELNLTGDPGNLRLEVVRRRIERDTEPPLLIVPPSAAGGAPDFQAAGNRATHDLDAESTPSTTDPVMRIEPVHFQPAGERDSGPRRPRPRVATVLLWVGLAGLAAAGWFVLTATTLELDIVPAPDTLSVEGGLLALRLGDGWLLRPGSYRVEADKPGYRHLDETIEVDADSGDRSHHFALVPLPGLLTVRSGELTGATVKLDGATVGSTPLLDYEIEPGEYEVRVTAERYAEVAVAVTIVGRGKLESVEVELEPRWATVTLASRPAGARAVVDGRTAGATPLTLELLEGTRTLEFLLAGYKPRRQRIEVRAGEALTAPVAVLVPADGNLLLTSEPSAADITVDGRYRGRTPLELNLTPAMTHKVQVSKAGFTSRTEELRIESGEQREVRFELEARRGKIRVTSHPAAEILLDGESRGTTPQTLDLTAVPHEVEIRLEGYVSQSQTVTPRPDFLQAIDATLVSHEKVARAAKEAATPDRLNGPQGHQFLLIEGGRFQMGASRREPGRRANEAFREVQITRRFYLATQEVSNRQFREFRDSHRSGEVHGNNLEIDHHAAVRVTWDDAARYCNWLSAEAGLPAAYVEVDGRLTATQPLTGGYRLPTEAEWAWAARYPDGGQALKYPWGASLPVAPDSGNYADSSARGLLPSVLSNYDDRYATTAPVDSYRPDARGFFNLGGNVAEWMHDLYAIAPGGTSGIDSDPSGPTTGQFHVIRGSSWMHSTVTELRLSYRDYGDKARPDLGFRVARYAD